MRTDRAGWSGQNLRNSSAAGRLLRFRRSGADAPAAQRGGRRPPECRRRSSRCCPPLQYRSFGPQPFCHLPRCTGPQIAERADRAYPGRRPAAPCNRHTPPLCFTRGYAEETIMGLLDVLNGMQNGPRGPSTPSAQSESGGGMSPMTMAILALLAWKGIKHFTGNQAGSAPRPAPAPTPGNVTAGMPGGGAGGMSDLLKGGLGGLLAGGAAGSVLSGGL